jgi:monoterpene epsilon-lactone hydrolase
MKAQIQFRTTLAVCLIALVGGSLSSAQTASSSQGSDGQKPAKVIVEQDGTVRVPEEAVPVSKFLSPEGSAYLVQHLHDMQDPSMTYAEKGIPRFMVPYLERQKTIFAVKMEDTKIGGVHAYVYTPEAGLKPANEKRVLINLHGGGFSGCWPGCAELESRPIAGLGGIKVVSVDYRQGPEYKFPAASEDVASVYRELLKSYKPENIGIYGCSAGGMLTSESVAWFQTHDLPRPGAIGVFCASAGAFGGDAAYTSTPLGEGRLMPEMRDGTPRLGYFSGTDFKDPLVSPLYSPEVLSKFPPTLVITGTRGFEMSGAVYTHSQLVKLGVDAELHVWEGMFHGFFYNPDVPESREAYAVIVRFFDRHLDTK